MYKTGGLESKKNMLIAKLGGVDFIYGEKFKMMMRDSLVDWGTFLEVYDSIVDYRMLFEQSVKLLNIQNSENLHAHLIPLLEKIYSLDEKSHLVCMMKQFMIYESLSIAIHSLHMVCRVHYESQLKRYLTLRNEHIKNKPAFKTNDIDYLEKYLIELNEQNNLSSSSVWLLFVNPPEELDVVIHLETDLPAGKKFADSIGKWHYKGFCPKVPSARLQSLMQFPIIALSDAIKELNPSENIVDYEALEEYTVKTLKEMPSPPPAPPVYKRVTPPKTDKITKAKFLIEEILAIRRSLVNSGVAWEQYYAEQAVVFQKIANHYAREF